ncbi:MAG: FkbM family methyltransferase [Halioglobus sp.]
MTPPTPIPLQIPGLATELALFVHGPRDRIISPRLRAEGIWEPFETRLIMSMLEPDQVFVDVGANLGYFSVLAAACVGSAGKVFAFEPDVDNFNLLCQNIEHNNYSSVISAEMAGLSEKDEVGQLFLSDDNLGDHQVFDAGGARNNTDISLLSGSNFLRHRTPHVHFFKIDTQGSEWAVIQGLMPLLRSQLQPARILVELTPLSLRQAGASGRQLIDTLAQLDQPFWIVDHIEHQLVRSTGPALATWCDNVDACAGDAGFMNILVGPGFSN